MGGKKFYTVFVGRKPGVYDSWPDCHAQVNGCSGNVYKSFESYEEAKTAFERYKLSKPAKGKANDSRLSQLQDFSSSPSTTVVVNASSSIQKQPKSEYQIEKNIMHAFAMGCLLGALASSTSDNKSNMD